MRARALVGSFRRGRVVEVVLLVLLVQAAEVVVGFVSAVRITLLKREVRDARDRAERDRRAMITLLGGDPDNIDEQTAAILANGLDAHEMSKKGVAARVRKELQRAEGEAQIAALLGEYLPMVEQVAPAAVETARKYPMHAKKILGPILDQIRANIATRKDGDATKGDWS